MSESTQLQPYESLTEDSMKAALIEARGDVFIASQLLKITVIRLDRAIRYSAALQAVCAGIRDVKQNESHQRASLLDYQQAVEQRLQVYRVVGLDALHELATMPLEKEDNSAWGQVKLAAASRLAGAVEQTGGGGELAETLRELRRDYDANAPKIRMVRTTMIEISPQASESAGGSTLEHPQSPE